MVMVELGFFKSFVLIYFVVLKKLLQLILYYMLVFEFALVVLVLGRILFQEVVFRLICLFIYLKK